MHDMADTVAIVALTQQGLATARRIGTCLTGARIHGYAPRVSGVDIQFDDVGAELRRLYASGADIVGVCAAGILIRTLKKAPSQGHGVQILDKGDLELH